MEDNKLQKVTELSSVILVDLLAITSTFTGVIIIIVISLKVWQLVNLFKHYVCGRVVEGTKRCDASIYKVSSLDLLTDYNTKVNRFIKKDCEFEETQDTDDEKLVTSLKMHSSSSLPFISKSPKLIGSWYSKSSNPEITRENSGSFNSNASQFDSPALKHKYKSMKTILTKSWLMPLDQNDRKRVFKKVRFSGN